MPRIILQGGVALNATEYSFRKLENVKHFRRQIVLKLICKQSSKSHYDVYTGYRFDSIFSICLFNIANISAYMEADRRSLAAKTCRNSSKLTFPDSFKSIDSKISRISDSEREGSNLIINLRI